MLAQLRGEVATGGRRVGEGLPALQVGREVAVAEFQRGGEGAGPGRAEAGQFRECRRRTLEQCAQRPMRIQQVARGGDRVATAQAGAEEDRQQFRIRQRRGAAAEEFFAGTLVGGPVTDMHGRRLAVRDRRRHRAMQSHRVS